MAQTRNTLFIVALLLFVLYSECAMDGRNLCNFHGYYYQDSQACECDPCYKGSNCTDFSSSCTLELTGGNPLLLQEYWELHPHLGEVTISSDYRTGYQYLDVLKPGHSTTGIGVELESAIRKLHKVVGNAETEGYNIVIGAGATNLVAASTYAMSQLMKKNSGNNAKLFVQQPYWFHYRQWAELPLGFISWNGSLNQDPSNIVEIVTIPNNPTGVMNVHKYATPYLIHDMVYYWPSWMDIKKSYNFDVMLFSMSKLTGHAGTRVAWALVKDPQVAALMQEWISLVQMYGSGIESVLRTIRLVEEVSSDGGKFFSFIRHRVMQRWSMLNKLFQTPAFSSRFANRSEDGFFYLWIECLRPADSSCHTVFLNETGIQGHAGSDFGSTDRFMRMDVPLRDDTFDIFWNRLQKLVV